MLSQVNLARRKGECSDDRREEFGVGLQKAIKKCWEVFQATTIFEVGDGRRVRFWHDLWCGGAILMESFPTLFFIAWSKDVQVVDVWEGWETMTIRISGFEGTSVTRSYLLRSIWY